MCPFLGANTHWHNTQTQPSVAVHMTLSTCAPAGPHVVCLPSRCSHSQHLQRTLMASRRALSSALRGLAELSMIARSFWRSILRFMSRHNWFSNVISSLSYPYLDGSHKGISVQREQHNNLLCANRRQSASLPGVLPPIRLCVSHLCLGCGIHLCSKQTTDHYTMPHADSNSDNADV